MGKAMIKRYVCILAIVFLTMHPTSKANAATEALEQAVLNSFNWGTLVASLEERKATAIAMQAYWQNFASRIPSLSPAERAWMDEEFKKTGEPLQRLFRSEIFAIDRLNDTANGCYTRATELIASQNPASDREMYYWSRMVRCYSDPDILIYLQNAKLSNGKADGDFKLRFSNMVLNRIVDSYLPSAMYEAMEW